MPLDFSLPKPPSLNHIYGYTSRGGFARSYITAKGKQWFADGIKILAEEVDKKHSPIEGPTTVYIKLRTCRRQDVDNIIKPTLDLLSAVCLDCQQKYSTRKACYCGQKRGILQDDVWVTKIIAEKDKVKKVVLEGIDISITPQD